MNVLKNLVLLLIFSTLLGIHACEGYGDLPTEGEDECSSPDYSNCDTHEPAVAILELKVTINSENPKVKVEIYDGNVESGYLYRTVFAESGVLNENVSVDRYYSAKAFYKSGADSIVAIDGDELKKISTSYCDSTCWGISGGHLDLRLK